MGHLALSFLGAFQATLGDKPLTNFRSAKLTATAVLAQSASFDNLCRVTGLDEIQAVNALDELLNRQLLLETEDMQTLARDPIYIFSHQKVNEVIYAEAGTARRLRLFDPSWK